MNSDTPRPPSRGIYAIPLAHEVVDTFPRRWLIWAIRIAVTCVVIAGLLAWEVASNVRTANIAEFPLVASQDVEFIEPGEYRFDMAGTLNREAFLTQFRIHDPSTGNYIGTNYCSVRSETTFFNWHRESMGKFIIERPGIYQLETTKPIPSAWASTHNLIVMHDYAGRNLLLSCGIILCGIALSNCIYVARKILNAPR